MDPNHLIEKEEVREPGKKSNWHSHLGLGQDQMDRNFLRGMRGRKEAMNIV